jgi:hypothetical protein
MTQLIGKKSLPALSDGWTRAQLDPTGSEIPVHEFLQVQHTHTKTLPSGQTRDYFTILEGVHRGKTASIRHTDGSSNLTSALPVYRGSIKLRFDARKAKLSYDGVELSAETDPRNPIRNGTHLIRLPDFPHPMASRYLSRSNKAIVWFYIGPGTVAVPGRSDFYLHPGTRSAGCVTVTDIGLWDALYQRLILSRHGDGLSVGTIDVINSTR